MGTDKRDRQKANKAAKLEAERAAAAKAKRTQTIRTMVIAGVVIVAVMVLITVLSGCGSSASDGGGPTDKTTTTAAGDETAADGKATYGTGECAPAEGTDKPVIDFDDAPKKCIDLDKTYTATFVTSKGDITVDLDTERTPVTTNNFINLARSGFYDGTDIHRVVSSAGFVQGGSPHTQDAADPGPGYTIPDEGGPFTAEDYTPGALAMARTSEPNSAGGQFFFLAHDGGTEVLSSYGTYAVFGKTTEGLDVLEALAALEEPGTEAPSEQIVLKSVTINES